MAERIRAGHGGPEEVKHSETLANQTAGKEMRGGGEGGSNACTKRAAIDSDGRTVAALDRKIRLGRGRTKSTAVISEGLLSRQQDMEQSMALLELLP
jgi:hypothetical protein